MASTTFRVVSTARWLADDFAAAAPPGVTVVHDLGLDLPARLEDTAWWCPMNYAARMLASGHNPRFTAPGPGFTAAIPPGLLGRRVAAGPLSRATRFGARWVARPVHAKVAEAKLRALPAAVHPDLGAFLAICRRIGVPAGAMVQLSDPVEMVTEARCFVLDRQVVAASVYLADGVTWDGFPAPRDASWAAGFASGVVARIRHQPRAYTLDVARLASHDLVVVEANPAWSSNPYHCQLGPVIDTVAAAQGATDRTAKRWAWTPDVSIPSRTYPLPRRREQPSTEKV